MEVRGVDFVTISVSDMERSKRFYQDVLGIKDQVLMESDGWVEFDTHPVSLSLGVPPKEFMTLPETVVALAVDDVHAAVEELRAKGVKVVLEPYESSVCMMACIEDPDRNRIFLHRRRDGTVG